MKKIIPMLVIGLCAITINIKAQNNKADTANDKTAKQQCCMLDTAVRTCNMKGKSMKSAKGQSCNKTECGKICKDKNSTCMNSKMTKGNTKSCDMNSGECKKMKNCPMMKD